MALKSSHEIRKLDPFWPKSYYLKGSCHLEVGKHAEKANDEALEYSHAVAEFRTCIKKQPQNKEAIAKLKESEELLEAAKEKLKAEVEKEMQERREARDKLMAKMAAFQEQAAKASETANPSEQTEVATDDVKIEAASEAVKA